MKSRVNMLELGRGRIVRWNFSINICKIKKRENMKFFDECANFNNFTIEFELTNTHF